MTIVSIKEARRNISRFITKAEQGEEIFITRRGKQVAHIQGISRSRPKLPLLNKFRKSITISGQPMSKTVIKGRSGERF